MCAQRIAIVSLLFLLAKQKHSYRRLCWCEKRKQRESVIFSFPLFALCIGSGGPSQKRFWPVWVPLAMQRQTCACVHLSVTSVAFREPHQYFVEFTAAPHTQSHPRCWFSLSNICECRYLRANSDLTVCLGFNQTSVDRSEEMEWR